MRVRNGSPLTHGALLFPRLFLRSKIYRPDLFCQMDYRMLERLRTLPLAGNPELLPLGTDEDFRDLGAACFPSRRKVLQNFSVLNKREILD